MSGIKTNDNTQWGLVSATGARPVPGGPGDGLEPLVDPHGRIFVIPALVGPPGFPARWIYRSPALANVQTILAPGPALGVVFSGFNNAGIATLYAQIYDLAVPPGALSVPEQSIPVAAMAEWSWSPDLWPFVAGITFALSTTPIGFTDPGGTLGYVNAQGFMP